MTNSYLDLNLGVQALRRRIERLQSGFGGALGVCASLLPHQLQNIQRVLTAPRVRHLLADEVGLGKTVQTLMIINALRLSEPGLRVLLIVPDALRAQWRDECLARAHEAPVELHEEEAERSVYLAWPGKLQQQDVDSDRYQMLVVDELHDLPLELQRAVEERAANFRHVLLLTATPALQDPEARERLLRVLEPERTALARLRGEDPLAVLEARDAEAAAQLASPEPHWEALGEAPPEESREAATALAHGLSRNVVRARRADYPGLLPTRQRHAIVVEPTAAEVERQRLMWRYFGHLGGLSRDFNVDKLAQRVLRGPQSLRQRVTFLLGHGHEREGLLAQVSELLGPEHGDSRFDALVDLLAALWRERPGERVLVVAQDNLTVDHLFKAVPQYLPRVGPGQGEPLVCARVRNQPDKVEEIAAAGELTENLVEFQEGRAQVLFAAEVGQVGLNLQCAQVLVFYSVPWSPQEVEQWIGRLDRIGRRAVLTELGQARPVEVYTLVQRGLVEERVVRVLDAFAVFRRGIRLDGTAILEVSKRIREAALAPEQVDWERLEADAAAMAEEEGAQLRSRLGAWLPYTPESALRLKTAVDALPPVEPVLLEHRGRPLEWQREEALLDWLKLLKRMGEYALWKEVEAEVDSPMRFWSLWYTFGALARSPVRSRVLLTGVLPELQDKSWKNRAAFFVHRRDAGQPPRREVWLPPEGLMPRRLDFLDHGSPLHEELVAGWEQLATRELREPAQWKLTVPREHPAEVFTGLLYLQVSWVDPGEHVLPLVDIAALARLRRFAIPSERPAVDVLERMLGRARAADARWIRALLPAQLVLTVLRWMDGQWLPASPAELWPWLLRPAIAEESPLIQCEPFPHREATSLVPAAEQAASTLARQQLAERWGLARAALPAAVAVRRYVCGVDAEDVLRLRAHEAGVEGSLTPEAWSEDDLSPLGLAHHVRAARQAWLAASSERAAQPELQRFASALCLVQRG
jgi:ATP-dependent helicase HepA